MSHLASLSEAPTLIGKLMPSRPLSNAGGRQERRRVPRLAGLPALRLSSGNDILPMKPSIKRSAGIDPPHANSHAV